MYFRTLLQLASSSSIMFHRSSGKTVCGEERESERERERERDRERDEIQFVMIADTHTHAVLRTQLF